MFVLFVMLSHPKNKLHAIATIRYLCQTPLIAEDTSAEPPQFAAIIDIGKGQRTMPNGARKGEPRH